MTAIVWMVLNAIFLVLALEDLREARRDWRAVKADPASCAADRKLAERHEGMSRYDVITVSLFLVAGIFSKVEDYAIHPGVAAFLHWIVVVGLFGGLGFFGWRIWRRRSLRKLILAGLMREGSNANTELKTLVEETRNHVKEIKEEGVRVREEHAAESQQRDLERPLEETDRNEGREHRDKA